MFLELVKECVRSCMMVDKIIQNPCPSSFQSWFVQPSVWLGRGNALCAGIMAKGKKKNKKTASCMDHRPSLNKFGAAACEHGQVRYQDLERLNDKLWAGIKSRDATIAQQSQSISVLTGLLETWKRFQKKNTKKINTEFAKEEKKTEEAWKCAVHWKRAYQSLLGMKHLAEEMGIDTENPELTEDDKKFNREHNLIPTSKQLESGKIKTIFKPVKKKEKLH